VDEIRGSNKCVSTIKFGGNRRFLAVGYVDGTTRLYDRKSDGLKSFIFIWTGVVIMIRVYLAVYSPEYNLLFH
ncbi:hypothetical protein WUBG_19146, partial [Wuchereria bancrofti]